MLQASFHRTHGYVHRAARHAITRALPSASAFTSSSLTSSCAAVASVSSSSHSTFGSSSSTVSIVPSVSSRSFASAAKKAAAAAPAEDEEGRQSAPGDAKSQGQSNKDTATAADPDDISSFDPYPPERIAELEKRYSWLDFNSMAKHLHMSDVHFFDQEVPYVDQDFTIKPDFKLLHRLEGANRLKKLQEAEDKKITRLLHFGYWVTTGGSVRVATEGKIRSVWTMVIAGDLNGTASFGIGKGVDMTIAEKRAMQDLRRNMLFVPLFESRTLSHEIAGRHGVCQVRMWPRPRARGMTAGMIPRMVFECFGIQDITAKVDGRMLPHHQVLAIFNGLRQVKSLREEAIRRGVTAHRMFERGLEQPRNPGRAVLFKRGDEVASMIREVRAMQAHESMLDQLGVRGTSSRAEIKYMVEQGWITKEEGDKIYKEKLEVKPEFVMPHYPKFGEAGEKSTRDGMFIPSYIERKPEPIDLGPHTASPPHPTSTKPGIHNLLFRYRGLPQPKPTPVAMERNSRVY